MQPFFLLTAHWRRNFRLRWKMGRRKFFNRALYFCNIWTRVDNSDIDGMYGWLSWFQDSVGCEFTYSFSTYNAHTRLGFQNYFSHRRDPCKSTCPPPSTSPWSLSLSPPDESYRKKSHMHYSQFHQSSTGRFFRKIPPRKVLSMELVPLNRIKSLSTLVKDFLPNTWHPWRAPPSSWTCGWWHQQPKAGHGQKSSEEDERRSSSLRCSGRWSFWGKEALNDLCHMFLAK